MLRLAAPAFKRDRREFAPRHYPRHVEHADKTGIADQVYLVARAGHGGGKLGHPVFGGAPRRSADAERDVRRRTQTNYNLPGNGATATDNPYPQNRPGGNQGG